VQIKPLSNLNPRRRQSSQPILPGTKCFTHLCPPHPNMTYAYQWQLQPLTTFPEFVSAKNTISTASTDFIAKEDLQCTSHVSLESDESYEEGWFRERFDKLTLTHIIGQNHKCAVSVSLTPAQWNMYIMDHSVPHIPLAKHTSDSWEDLSPVMKSCKRAAERQQTSDRSIIFSPSLQCNSKKGDILRLELTCRRNGRRALELLPIIPQF